ncbi:hypothetical protein [Streptomyces sp. AK02-04a]|nr:hypothetical protein [Streptomyces sp. AK02-04a]MDX3762785.1 hypothetical protein [Streptomyces sp. AK02-04a]
MDFCDVKARKVTVLIAPPSTQVGLGVAAARGPYKAAAARVRLCP